jgi:hypothetical protein
MEKLYTNQQLAGMNLLAGYLMGLCGNRQNPAHAKRRNASNPAKN